jgi:two-component system chemotaxis response regulator CheY
MNKTILVVDDSASIRHVVNIALTGAGYNVIEASDGEDALKKLDSSSVNLVISDVNMPNMGGIELLKAIKSRPDTKFTPVIMLTTESEASIKDQGREAGAKAWMVKPFQPAQMVDAVSKLIAM